MDVGWLSVETLTEFQIDPAAVSTAAHIRKQRRTTQRLFEFSSPSHDPAAGKLLFMHDMQKNSFVIPDENNVFDHRERICRKTQDDSGLSKAYLVLEAKTQQERDLEKIEQTIRFEVNESRGAIREK